MAKKQKPGDGTGEPPVDLTIVGTNGADRLNGDSGDDTFFGLGGDDKISGGDGFDTAVYSGSINDFSWVEGRRGAWIVTDDNTADGDEGTDTLKSIEAIQFDDYTYLLTEDNPVVITYQTVTVYADETISVTIEAVDLDDRSLGFDGSFNPTTQGFFRDITYTKTYIANGSIIDYSFEFDPTTVDRSYLAEGEAENVTFEFRFGSNTGGWVDYNFDIIVLGRNDAPTLGAGAVVDITEDEGAVTFDLSTLGADVDSDDDGSSLTYSIVGAPAGLNIQLAGTVLTVDPAFGFQKLNTGETKMLTIQIQATDQWGAVSEVQEVSVAVHGADDPIPSYYNYNGEFDYAGMGIDIAAEPFLGDLNGGLDDPDYPGLVAFTTGDDTRVIKAQSIELFKADINSYLIYPATNYDDLAFNTDIGDDKLIFRLEGDAIKMKSVDVNMTDGEDLLIIDAFNSGVTEITGNSFSTGDHNDQILISIGGPGTLQFGFNDFYLGAGNDILDIAILGTDTDGINGLGLFKSNDIFLGDGNDLLNIRVLVQNAIWADIDARIYAGNGDDTILISNRGTTLSPSATNGFDTMGLYGEVNMGSGNDVFVFDVTARDGEGAVAYINGGPSADGSGDDYDIVNLMTGNMADFSITQTGDSSYTVVQGGQTLHFVNVEEINAMDGSLFDLL